MLIEWSLLTSSWAKETLLAFSNSKVLISHDRVRRVDWDLFWSFMDSRLVLGGELWMLQLRHANSSKIILVSLKVAPIHNRGLSLLLLVRFVSKLSLKLTCIASARRIRITIRPRSIETIVLGRYSICKRLHAPPGCFRESPFMIVIHWWLYLPATIGLVTVFSRSFCIQNSVIHF